MLNGQKTRIYGVVKDSLTGEPVPMASIFFQGTSIGTTSDFEGVFKIETNEAVPDSVSISCLGYLPQKAAIRKNQFQEIDFLLKTNSISLKVVEILSGENPADILLKKVWKNKKKNNPDNVPYYDCEVYGKLQVDVNNIDSSYFDTRATRPFNWILQFADTSMVNGKVYLPLFLSESVSDMFFRAEPKSNREIINAYKVSGIENESVTRFMGKMYQSFSIYDNYITLFDKNFVSPIGFLGQVYYKYYLTDSVETEQGKAYKLMFKPRRKQEPTFTGFFWVNDSSYSIREYEIKVVDDANINFVNDLVMYQHFSCYNNEYWMPDKEKITVDFNLLNENKKSTMGFYAHKSSSYQNYVFNQPKESGFYANPERILILPDAGDKDSLFWNTHRHDSLNRDEQVIYFIVDSVKKMPLFRTYYDIVNTIFTGYYVSGNFEFGPYASTISKNEIEGWRLRLGMRTSNKFSKRVMPSAYLAYGFLDREVKYGGGLLYMFDKNPRRTFEFKFKHDMEQLGMSATGFREDFFLTSFLSRNAADKLTMVNEFSGAYEHEWFTGFSNTLRFVQREIFPIGSPYFNFGEVSNDSLRKSVTSSEFSLDLHFAYKEKFFYGEFLRTSLGTKYPTLNIRYTRAVKDVFNSDYNYQRLNVNYSHWFNVGAIGWSKYVIDAGKIWGNLPYPFLKLHEGNETFVQDETSFNMMNYFEFVSDEWVSVYYIHRFEGLFLNRIPLLRKLKWRELIWAKGLVGHLSDSNRDFSRFPSDMYELDRPYYEAGIGIENIFKVLRIDGVWRLSHLDHPEISKFQVMVGLQLLF